MSGVTPARVVRSEWTKLRSLRSTRLSLLVAAGLIVGLGAVIPAVTVADWTAADEPRRAGFDAFQTAIGGIFLAQLAFGVLGVLLITGEWATGMARATFAAVPRRLPVLWAKLLVFAAVTVVLAGASCLTAFLVGQAILAKEDLAVSLGDPHIARALVGSALYLTAIGALGLGLGATLRSTAGGVATLFGLLLVLPTVVSALPGRWADRITPYLPMDAGLAVVSPSPEPTMLAPWAGFGVLCAYAAGAILLAAVLLVRRDV
jgi:ABC-2 type transport system permease protein